MISLFSFDFRGDGFYKNEHGNGAHKLERPTQGRRIRKELRERGYTWKE